MYPKFLRCEGARQTETLLLISPTPDLLTQLDFRHEQAGAELCQAEGNPKLGWLG